MGRGQKQKGSREAKPNGADVPERHAQEADLLLNYHTKFAMALPTPYNLLIVRHKAGKNWMTMC